MSSSVFSAIFFSFVGGLIPSLLWGMVVLTQDQHSEKKRNLVWVFGIGAAVAVPVILAVRSLDWGIDTLGVALSEQWYLFITGALIEEVLKGGALYLFVFRRDYFDEPIDTFIYGAAIALGFAAVENIIFVGGEFILSTPTIQVIGLLMFRTVTAVIVHLVSTAFIAYGLYIGVYARSWLPGVLSVILGIGVHGAYNLLLSATHEASLFINTYTIIMLGAGVLMYRRVSYLQHHSHHKTHLDETD
ncbi:MAG: hypothetical protein BRC23_02335 [Parcubacteria group bacterium SW_4_49_11]|nr:MAG: hypothetical protein BRC23_02335 [Parcubacteria group bacterium SW_4_49_11]